MTLGPADGLDMVEVHFSWWDIESDTLQGTLPYPGRNVRKRTVDCTT